MSWVYCYSSLAEIPPEENILDAGKELLAATKLWKQGKTFHKIVKTYHHPKDVERGVPWHARVSEHGPEDASFAQFWDKLGNDKANNEKCFVPDIKRVIQIKELSPTSTIWTLHYSFSPALISPRVFTVLQVTQLTEVDSRKEGFVFAFRIRNIRVCGFTRVHSLVFVGPLGALGFSI